MQSPELKNDVEFSEFHARLADEFRNHFEELNYADLAQQVSQQSSERNPKHYRNYLGDFGRSMVAKQLKSVTMPSQK